MRQVASAKETLAALPSHRREVFDARLRRWRPDLIEALAALYDDPEATAQRLIDLAARAFAVRSEDLHRRDLERGLEPDWFQRPDALGYAAYTERFARTLSGVGDHLDHLRHLGVTYLHLMPLLEPCPPPNDGGYAVADYRAVRADLGTIDDLADLAGRLRAAGISLCLDLVLNHVAHDHEWAQRARAGDVEYLDYFLTYPDRDIPDRYEQTLPEVFPDFAPGNFTFDPELQRWVWTTFNAYQWDVNWANPEVLCEYADIVFHLANVGVEVLRLDAIAFTWKRMGTSSQNQPEVHDLTQALRVMTRIVAPAMIFKAEAIVGPRDLVSYLGTGSHHGKVSDLAYHNSLMVQIWSMMASRDARLGTYALQQLPAIPASTAWVTYARCHDDIGWAIDDGDAAAMGISGHGHRGFLSDFYTRDFPGSWARGVEFQFNAETGDRRISGSLASLAGADCGDPWAVDRIVLAHTLMLGFGGLPVLWMGDEVGLRNDERWEREPGHETDNRWIHRPVMPWRSDGTVADPLGVLPRLRQVVSARRRTPHLHAATATTALWPEDDGVLLLLRRHPLGPMLGAYNVTDQTRGVSSGLLRGVGLGPRVTERLTRNVVDLDATAGVPLKPYGAVWFTD